MFVGGDIVTNDPDHPRVTALALRGNRVLAIGDDATVRSLAGPDTRVVELGGKSVTPGLVDGHCHLYGMGTADELFAQPGHPYTAGLLNSTPRVDLVMPRLVSIDGAPPDLVDPPTGCPFAARCSLAVTQCLDAMPGLKSFESGRKVACWRPFEVVRA